MISKQIATYLLGFLSLSVITIMFAFSLPTTSDFDAAKQELMFRNIGHQVLLHSGDRTSRVLPIKRIGENEFQITFENEFSFQPDSLANIVKLALPNHNMAPNYIVNVVNCNTTDVVFGYAISKNERNNIMACSGRMQPKSCYLIRLKFQNEGMSTQQKGYLLGGLPLLAFVGLLFTRAAKPRKVKLIENLNSTTFKVGNTIFNREKQQLLIDETQISLTVKESKLLLIFVKSPNLIVERSRLQKEIWEDEGVIVGRSLDMFISKLRKKLEADPSIELANIHGKGYQLKIK